MKNALILYFLLFFNFPASAQEDFPGDDYDKFVNDNGRLLPFNVGYIRCDRAAGIWGERCQDALAESIYGENWEEIKEVILAFQQAIIHRDYRYIKGKTVIPKNKLAVFIKIPKENAKYIFEGELEESYIWKEKKLNELYFKRVPEKVLNIIKNTKYEDIYLDHERERG